MSLLHQIKQSARGRDQDINATVKRLYLRPLSHSAVYHRMLEFQIPSIGLEPVADLDGQLTGWRKNQRAGPPGLGPFFQLG